MWEWDDRFPTSANTGSPTHSAGERCTKLRTLILMEIASDLLLFSGERVVCVITRESQKEEVS